jgi:predicted transcriptional regulator
LKLFGIKTEGQLGGSTEIRDAYKIFANTYVNERQQAIEEVFNQLFEYVGIKGEYELIPVEPLSFEFSEGVMAANMTREEIREKLGLASEVVTNPSINVTEQPIAASNESIKNLTGRQYQNVMRIVRQFTNGKLSKEQAALMLKNGFAFTDSDVNTFLGLDTEQFSEEERETELLEMFAEFGENLSDYEVLSDKSAREFNYFAEVKQLSQLEADILGYIKKDKRISSEGLAEVLKQDVKVVEAALQSLVDNKILDVKEVKIGQDKIIERVRTNVEADVPKPKNLLSIAYKYSLRATLEALGEQKLIATSRPFCVKMIQLSETQLWSRARIEQMSARLGYSVFDRVGGFWNNGGDIETQCRHEWRALIIQKKK